MYFDVYIYISWCWFETILSHIMSIEKCFVHPCFHAACAITCWRASPICFIWGCWTMPWLKRTRSGKRCSVASSVVNANGLASCRLWIICICEQIYQFGVYRSTCMSKPSPQVLRAPDRWRFVQVTGNNWIGCIWMTSAWNIVSIY